MIKDILYKSDILDGLFTQKDFEFLKDSNSRQEELEFQIKMAGLKRDQIIEAIKKIDIEGDEVKNINPKHLKKCVDSAESAFESINIVIRNLNSILDEFNEIEKDILELVVKKESHEDIDTNDTLNQIYDKISEFKRKQKKVEDENNKYELIVDKFLDESEIDKLIKQDVKLRREEKRRINNFDNSKANKYDEELKDNLELRVSEKQKRVYLPYTKAEIEGFLENYPEEYKSAKDVINQEFITDISIYNKHPVLARFREAYSLSRNREMKSAIDSLKFAVDLMFRSDINPTIIAAVKSQQQLETYIQCLESNQLENFKYFTIIFEVNPI